MQVSTVATTMALADQNHAEELKRVCLDFISKNLSAVMVTEGYQHMISSCPSLQVKRAGRRTVGLLRKVEKNRGAERPATCAERATVCAGGEGQRIRPLAQETQGTHRIGWPAGRRNEARASATRIGLRRGKADGRAAVTSKSMGATESGGIQAELSFLTR